jgi:membrane protease YdiL (CAAX protease family)
MGCRTPAGFSLAGCLIFILMVLFSSIVANAAWSGDTPEWYVGGTLGRLVSIIILLMLLSRLGWLGPAGFTRPGPWSVWLVLLIPLAYAIAGSAYAMTGNLDFSYAQPALAGSAALFLMAHAFLEETAFRGLIMHGFVRRWGSTNRGVGLSVLVSSLLFGSYHLIYLAGEPLPVVLMRIIYAFLLGIFLGALVSIGKSIHPAAFFHGVLNLAGYLNLTSNGIEGTPSSWLLMSLLMIPIAVFGIYLLRVVPLD